MFFSKFNLKNLFLSTIITLSFSSVVFAENKPSPCEFIKTTYQLCEKSKVEFKNLSPVDRRKNCSFLAINVSIDMYNALINKTNDANLSKNLALTLGLICKDACMGTDDFYTSLKEKLCK